MIDKPFTADWLVVAIFCVVSVDWLVVAIFCVVSVDWLVVCIFCESEVDFPASKLTLAGDRPEDGVPNVGGFLQEKIPHGIKSTSSLVLSRTCHVARRNFGHMRVVLFQHLA